jgi:hypothetical protein
VWFVVYPLWIDGACQSVNRINGNLFSLFRNFQHSNLRNVLLIFINYFQNCQKGEWFLYYFEALVREIYIRGWLLRSRNVILKVVSSKKMFFIFEMFRNCTQRLRRVATTTSYSKPTELTSHKNKCSAKWSTCELTEVQCVGCVSAQHGEIIIFKGCFRKFTAGVYASVRRKSASFTEPAVWIM